MVNRCPGLHWHGPESKLQSKRGQGEAIESRSGRDTAIRKGSASHAGPSTTRADDGTESFSMKISSIPQIYRNINRGTEILSVLSKYGLASWISRLNLDFAKGLLKDRDGEALARHSREARIRMG